MHVVVTLPKDGVFVAVAAWILALAATIDFRTKNLIDNVPDMWLWSIHLRADVLNYKNLTDIQ